MNWLRGHWQLCVIMAVVVALWATPVMLPLKILVVFFHELAHGLAAILTGGQIEAISVSPDQGGVTMTRGGSRFVILSAGYIGSLLFGVMLLLAGLKSRADRAIAAGLGLVMLAIMALYLRGLFPMAFGGLTGIALLAMARFLPAAASDLALRTIGLTSMIYVPLDIFSDTIARSQLRSDAFMLGEYLGGGAAFWGGVWLIISLAVIGLCLRYGLGQASNVRTPETPPTV